jgi:hypothetical protein
LRIACAQLPYTRANATVFGFLFRAARAKATACGTFRSDFSCKSHGVRKLPLQFFVQKTRPDGKAYRGEKVKT